jgi:hypothetical protein
MQITQVYNKKTEKVLCCEIPWDVASQRTGIDIYSKKDECIMLWPDRSLDLYHVDDTGEMIWIRKICDVGVEFDIVWAQFWEYHGLRGEQRAILTEISPVLPPATVEDIFEDVRDLVRAVSDADDQAKLAAEVDKKKSRFYSFYDDCRYKENGQQAYTVITDFVKVIQQKLGEHDQNSQKVAAFLVHFTFEMCLMLQTFGPPGKSFEDRIQERLKTYYQDKQCPMQLRLAKLKRRGSE